MSPIIMEAVGLCAHYSARRVSSRHQYRRQGSRAQAVHRIIQGSGCFAERRTSIYELRARAIRTSVCPVHFDIHPISNPSCPPPSVLYSSPVPTKVWAI
ncbi:unnamed protein product, partial [Mycena citricolor]